MASQPDSKERLAIFFDELLSSVAQKNESVRKEKHSVSTRIRFSQKKLTHMSKTFKKEFIANGLAAHVIKRPSGKTGSITKYATGGTDILIASAKNIKDAKQKFLKMTEPGEIEKYQAKQEKTGLYLLDEIAYEWLKYKQGKVVPQTWNYYESQYRRYISPILGKKSVLLIKTIDIDGIMSGVTGRLYEDLRTLFSQIFKYAVNSGIIAHNPVSLILFKKSDRVSHNALSVEQIKTLLSALERPEFAKYKQPFLIMLYFGLRPCELADAHFEGDFLIARNAKRKNGKIEYKKIPVSDMIRGKINFDSVTKPGITNSLNRVFKRIMNDESATQYSLRHTFATVCQQYVRPDIVDIWMGDSSERLVGRVYTHFPDDFMLAQMNTVIFTV